MIEVIKTNCLLCTSWRRKKTQCRVYFHLETPILFVIITAHRWVTKPPASDSVDPSVAPVSTEGQLTLQQGLAFLQVKVRLHFQQSLGWVATQVAPGLPVLSYDVDRVSLLLPLSPFMDALQLCVPRKIYRQVYGPKVSLQHPDPQRAHVRGRMK